MSLFPYRSDCHCTAYQCAGGAGNHDPTWCNSMDVNLCPCGNQQCEVSCPYNYGKVLHCSSSLVVPAFKGMQQQIIKLPCT